MSVALRPLLLLAASLFLAPVLAAENNPMPVGGQSWWWDDDFWSRGQIAAPANHAVDTRWIDYAGASGSIPALVARPAGKGKYPAVLYIHGRRGLDDFIQLQVKRIAARGFVVLAPDIYRAHFIPPMPVEHDYALEADADKGIDALLALPDVSTRQACLASHTRGGYFALKLAVSFQRQDRDIACYVGWYPHMQDPNAPEALQVYSYAREADELRIPTLIFIGEEEQYQRRRGIETAVANMEKTGRPARLIVYPGVGRGFDFRPPNVRTFADDLASKDALQRAAVFIQNSLVPAKK